LYERVKEGISEKHRNTLEFILKNGSLSTRILNSLDGDFSEEKLHKLYSRLGKCLLQNTLFKP
ncbi:MAG: glutamate--cysteine ligase, partial [Bacteroidota bacterium]